MNVSSTHRFSGWRGLNQTQVYFLRIDHKVGTTHTPTLRLVLERGCDESVNLQLSVPSVSALAWGSGMSRDAPPDDGKIPKERGRSLLGRLKKIIKRPFLLENRPQTLPVDDVWYESGLANKLMRSHLTRPTALDSEVSLICCILILSTCSM